MNPDVPERVPTTEELADNSLDGRYVIKHFLGKTLAEAEELFAEGCAHSIPLTYTDDLYFMEPVGFRFYIRAVINFCLSDRASGQCDFINGVAGAISSWREFSPEDLIPCAHLLAEFCVEVYRQFDRYDADPEIYEGLREKYSELAKYLTRVAAEAGQS
jgi:hypothetical protein